MSNKLRSLQNKVIGLIEHESLVDPEGRAHRREMIDANTDPVRRLGALTLHSLTPLFAASMRKRQLELYESNGLSFIGTGAHSSVLLSPEGKIIKIIRDSATKPQQERDHKASELQDMIAITADCHTNESLATVVTPNFPLIVKGNEQRNYLALIQEFTEGADAIGNPAVQEKVRQFAERSLDIMGSQGMLPDLIGHNNLLAKEDETIVLVDTVPMPEDDLTSQRTGSYRRNLEVLRGLAKTAQ